MVDVQALELCPQGCWGRLIQSGTAALSQPLDPPPAAGAGARRQPFGTRGELAVASVLLRS